MISPPFKALTAAYQLHFYLCFKTHTLLPLLASEAEHALVENVLEDVCAREQYHLLESQVTVDHLRLLLSMKPDQRGPHAGSPRGVQETISRAVKMLKGNLSRQFGLAFPDQLKSHKADTLWARGYFASSSGKVNLDAARRYVEAQADHHGYQGAWTSNLKFRNLDFKSPAFELEHCVCKLTYHVVLVTRSRISIFDETIAPHLFEYAMTVGRKHGFAVDRVGLLPDHFHLVIEVVPSLSIHDAVLALLNNTFQWLLKHYSGVVKQTGAWDVWQPSYYAGTVGEYSTAQVKRFLGQS